MRRLGSLALAFLLAFPLSIAAEEDFRLLRIDGFVLKWDAPALGARAEVSWGLAERAQRFGDAVNCRALAPAAAMARAVRGETGALERLAAEAFAMWSAAVDIDFRRAGAGERPDILIGAQGEPFRVAFANVWHDGAAAEGEVAPLTRATICLNPDAAWIVEGPAPVGAYHLRTVLAHEIGHAIGLDHPGPSGALMGFQNPGVLDALLPGDVAGGVALYGRRPAQRVALR